MGQQVGKYDVLAPLTEGGMAQLFLGSTAGPGGFRKYVVIKRVLPEAVGDENLERMFLDEARITAAFSHPGIAQVFDLGEDEGGLYVVMEFIAGQNLNQVVYACARQRAVLPLAFSTSVVHECALALHYAHTFRTPSGEQQPVIHRDVAQKNIMVTYDGQVKLLDFGIAKVKNALSKTRAGTVKGTAGYMSPEQVRGEVIDGRSDVFSLGVVLWEMATGHRLFSGETELDELRLILEAPIQPPSELEPSVPLALSEVVMKALHRDRQHRYATARDLARALQTQCGDLLFDAEGRAEFMRERFAEKIVATQALFDSAESDELDAAIVRYRDSRTEFDHDKTPNRQRTNLSAGKLEGVRGNGKPRNSIKKLKPVKVPKALTAEEQELERQIEAVARGELPDDQPLKLPKRSPLVPVALVLLLIGVGYGTWRVQSSLEDAPPQPALAPEPLRVNPDAVPGREAAPVKDPVVVAKDPPPKETKVAAPRTPTPPGPSSGGTGDVTLVLFPNGKVRENGRLLGSGNLVTFSLPAGNHLLTIVGEDGVEHRLNVPVVGGKKQTMKLQVNELP